MNNKDREWQKKGKLVRHIVEELTKECPTLDERKEILQNIDAVISILGKRQ